jgi:hypothetical protein
MDLSSDLFGMTDSQTAEGFMFGGYFLKGGDVKPIESWDLLQEHRQRSFSFLTLRRKSYEIQESICPADCICSVGRFNRARWRQASPA